MAKATVLTAAFVMSVGDLIACGGKARRVGLVRNSAPRAEMESR